MTKKGLKSSSSSLSDELKDANLKLDLWELENENKDELKVQLFNQKRITHLKKFISNIKIVMILY